MLFKSQQTVCNCNNICETIDFNSVSFSPGHASVRLLPISAVKEVLMNQGEWNPYDRSYFTEDNILEAYNLIKTNVFVEKGKIIVSHIIQ